MEARETVLVTSFASMDSASPLVKAIPVVLSINTVIIISVFRNYVVYPTTIVLMMKNVSRIILAKQNVIKLVIWSSADVTLNVGQTIMLQFALANLDSLAMQRTIRSVVNLLSVKSTTIAVRRRFATHTNAELLA